MYFYQIIDDWYNLLNLTFNDVTNDSNVRRKLKNIVSSLNLDYIGNHGNSFMRISNGVSRGCFRINIPSNKMAIRKLIKLLDKFYEKKGRNF